MLEYVRRALSEVDTMKEESPGAVAGDSESGSMLDEYYIPDYILIPDSTFDKASHIPACPVIVFINSKSGGQLGGELLKIYRTLLNKNQVFDLGEKAPDKVLHQFYVNLEKHKQSGDSLATEIEKRLRIIVAGGDGTAGWLLGVVCDLKLPRSPPIATVPLGTGNNLPFAFGWGKKNPDTNSQSVVAFLDQVRNAKEMKIDSWHILMRMRAPKEGSCDPIAPPELPHSLHAFHRVTQDDTLNKSSYAKIVGEQGWFFASLCHPFSRNIAQLAKVRIMKRPGQWEDLQIPRSIRSIVCLNLPSFSGGLNPWGTPNRKKMRYRDLTAPYVDDGLIEVVGFRNAWHGLVLLAPSGHGTRLAQANRIRFEFHKGAAEHTFMRIDGEPWKQPLPADDDTVVVEISHFGQVSMLANPFCRAKSIQDPSSPYVPEDDDCDSNEELEEEEDWEEKRKLGAADTFRLPEGVDIAHLS
ncbi:hypothetical protein RHMOL_Rhmol06G0285900 [Rhododendron molle]|uniref:Uncharacterized protein n=1 Tax=Rhododendron molle TaxID=49168 RepID=A0ACC0NHE0_RHOML|nr:hypothetical protein RHMOL_Rhmol06G0285900 [Rhododendron molle]